MLKPTSSSPSLIGLKPTYLSLSLSSLYILILLHVGVTSNPILVFGYSSFSVFFSLQHGIRARNILGFLRRRRHWHLLQSHRHLLQRRRHQFLAYASSSSRLRRHHVVIASSSRLRRYRFLLFFFVCASSCCVASSSLSRLRFVLLPPLLRRRHRRRLSAAYHRGRRLSAQRLSIALRPGRRRVVVASRRRVACLSALLRPCALTSPRFALRRALPFWLDRRRAHRVLPPLVNALSVAPCYQPSGLTVASCFLCWFCPAAIVFCCLRSVAGLHTLPLLCRLPAVTPCPVIALCPAGAPLYRPAAFALLPPLTGTAASTHIPPPVHLP